MKKEIKMQFGNKVLTFQIISENITDKGEHYIFAECQENSSARGFFTSDYIFNNEVK